MTDLPQLSRPRIIALRILFAFVALGQFAIFWPLLLSHTSEWALTKENEVAILGGMTLLMALGVKSPVRMLPVLLLEFVWKTVWMLTIYLPLSRAGRLTDATRESFFEVGIGVLLTALVIPWGYVFQAYIASHPREG